MHAADVVGLGAVLVADCTVDDSHVAEVTGTRSVVGDVMGTHAIEAPEAASSSRITVGAVGLTSRAERTSGGSIGVVGSSASRTVEAGAVRIAI